MPKRKIVKLSNGQTVTGGYEYDETEAVQWFLDNAAQYYELGPGTVKPSGALLRAWDKWVEVCKQLWGEHVHSNTGMPPEMPTGFPIDAMHTVEGDGISIADGCRSYSEGLEPELAAMSVLLRRRTFGSKLYVAQSNFSEEIMNCLPMTVLTEYTR